MTNNWYKTHKEDARIYSRRHYWRVKSKLVELLGGKCEGCGEDDIRKLRIISKERTLKKGIAMMKELIEVGTAEQCILLCLNCAVEREYAEGKKRVPPKFESKQLKLEVCEESPSRLEASDYSDVKHKSSA